MRAYTCRNVENGDSKKPIMRSYTCKKLTWEKVMKQWIAKSYSKS
jgi:hypothetical protein